jgi:hypothetical protein
VNTSQYKLVNAELILIQESISLNCDYFILLSPQCLPIRSSPEFYEYCKTLNGKSQISNKEPWFNDYLNDSFLNKYTTIWGGPQWKLISRELQIKIIQYQLEIIEMTVDCTFFDCEVTIQSILKKYYLLTDSLNYNADITYTNWKFPENRGRSPRTLLRKYIFYDLFSIIYATKKRNFFFARKFVTLNYRRYWHKNGQIKFQQYFLLIKILSNIQFFILIKKQKYWHKYQKIKNWFHFVKGC